MSRTFHFHLLLVYGVRRDLGIVNQGIFTSQVVIHDDNLAQCLSPSEKQL